MKIAVVLNLLIVSLVAAAGSAYAQSTDQMFPTPVRTPEITSSIKSRAIGDPRLTTYYYTFDGQQGDVFINVQSKNFTGDIDVYLVPSQQPLTKIVIYGDQPEAETGRVIYLRKPERILLRIQGRSPGDDDASVRVKFAGSFSASTIDDAGDPAVPKVESVAEPSVRVNSVGTIVEVIPKPARTPGSDRLGEMPEPHEGKDAEAIKPDAQVDRKVDADDAKSAQVVVTDPVGEEKRLNEIKPSATPRNRNRRRATATPANVAPPAETAEEKRQESGTPAPTSSSTDRRSESRDTDSRKVDPMTGINLVIYFKDGSRVDRPMTEVQRFSVERAVLTVISKNGTVGRYKMTEVSRVSIE